jgi:trimeric autotransporter adhesin
MSTLRVTNIQHPSADSPAIELDPTDGVVFSAASFDAAAITSGVLDAARIPPVGFTQSVTFTASDASYSIPTDARKAGVKVTVVGAGGGGGTPNGTVGGDGGSSTFNPNDEDFVTAAGGLGGGFGGASRPGTDGFASGNGGEHGPGSQNTNNANRGGGGKIEVKYLNLSNSTSAVVTIGAGGTGSGAGGRGEIILEY